jgi:hypothetical protein
MASPNDKDVPGNAPEPAPSTRREELLEERRREEQKRREREREREAVQSTPSSSEMAGDGAVGGDGIDEPGWD